MKTIKILFVLTIGLLFKSCSVEVIQPIDPIYVPSAYDKLRSYELWYVNIHETQGNGQVPFFQKAFTLSFNTGTLYANNNLVGIGQTGNGYGISVGYYNVFDNILEISHDLDGYWDLEVYVLGPNKIELYHRPTHTSYYLYGYQRNTFDYDLVFYDNIHYFLQEYEAWEKVGTFDGVPNPFDSENYIQFLAGGFNNEFRSSQDNVGLPISNVFWDYSGLFNVSNFSDTNYVKALTLDYDYFSDEYFELSIINDGEIELYQPASGTIYRFVGRNFIQYKNKKEDRLRKKIIMNEFHKESSKRLLKKK